MFKKKSLNLWLIGLFVLAGLVASTTTFYGLSFFRQGVGESNTSAPTIKKLLTRKITALGRLQPLTEVIRLSAPQTLGSDRVAQLFVKEGDKLKKGQIIATLDSKQSLQLALKEAQEQVRVAQSRYDQIKAGAKAGDIQAQKATITKLQAELQGEIATQKANIARWQSEVTNAQAEYNRFQSLYQQGAIAVSDFDRKGLALETAQAQLAQASAQQNGTVATLEAQITEAKEVLNRIAEVRPVDLQAAKTEIDRANAAVKRAQNDLNQADIKAPIAGQIIKIHARPGEKLTDQGIADLAQTNDMVAIAEVYQTDIAKIRVGQKALITSQAFTGQVKGTVYELGLEVIRQNVFSNQPGENLDRRVVEVKVRLQPKDSERVSRLTNLQVQVAIEI
ncbi:ABC exporter membrane fusion protein [Nostoc sp. C117]|uniref:ABC exporter membrane fusion protein n=1 Tax=Nostoc sp. C117 TaxID=3349875 RepID=UPI00370D64EB